MNRKRNQKVPPKAANEFLSIVDQPDLEDIILHPVSLDVVHGSGPACRFHLGIQASNSARYQMARLAKGQIP